MKTKPIECPLALSQSFHETPAISRIANFGRVLVATSCVSLVSFATVPAALAGGANGTYKFKKAYGTVKFGGDSVDIPESIAKKIAGVVQGEVTIRNRKLQLKKSASARIVENLGHALDISLETSVSGPASVELTKTGNSYTGETEEPIVVSFDGNFLGEDFSGELVTDVAATVESKKLKVVITFSGAALIVPVRVTSMRSKPSRLIAPPNTVMPTLASTGTDSPVIDAVSRLAWPDKTRPSAGTRSPARTSTVSPDLSVPLSTSMIEPSA